jgi:hypothetical protein
MSLINDALKRATQAQPTNSSAPESETPMQPVDQPRAFGLPIYFIPVMLIIISGASWFLFKGWQARRQTVALHAREAASKSAEDAIQTNRQFALNNSATAAGPSAGAPPSASATPPDAPPAAAHSEPAFKLQGIFYLPSRPAAVVNSRTVFIGDIIANGKVKAIDRQSVTLEVGTETMVLTLP